ncbi:MAG: hypothetical protein ABJP70_04565 [Erythrobacter sp.]
MKKIALMMLAPIALAGCGGEASEGGDDAAPAGSDIVLANGMPTVEGFEEGDVSGDRKTEANGMHEVTYIADGSVADVFDFYKAHYSSAGLGPKNTTINFSAEDTDYGGYVSVFSETDDIMVHVSPRKGSGEFSASTQLGDGFPIYEGVAEGDYDIRPRSDGSRMVIFRPDADPADIAAFYRAAGEKEGFELKSVTYSAGNDTENVKIGIIGQDEGVKVVAATYGQ